MNTISVDFSNQIGLIKPMHCVNNGPGGSDTRKTSNTPYFLEAGFPCARLHDSAFYAGYGGEFAVDVHRVFRNFDADESDPASYSFKSTDAYIEKMSNNGIDIMYRLGCNIEHGEKCGTIPPKDFKKWARICEHIIMHYNYGWANGYKKAVKYWEIWNEPDLGMTFDAEKGIIGTSDTQPNWQGDFNQFLDLFITSYGYLKEKFPNEIIGGPAFTGFRGAKNWACEVLLDKLNENNLKLDFFSYHCYQLDIKKFVSMVRDCRKMLNKKGQTQCLSVLDEYNYIEGWQGETMFNSFERIKNHVGASFFASVMLSLQNEPLDMLMYYDARPCAYNGLFSTDTLKPLKSFYVAKDFNKLYQLKNQVKVSGNVGGVYCVGATGKGECAVMLSSYKFVKGNGEPSKELFLDIKGLDKEKTYAVEFILTDKAFDRKTVKKLTVKNGGKKIKLDIKLHDVLLIEIKPV